MISDDEFESILRDALVDYVGETPDYPGELSPKYQRRFKRMLADPAGYVKRRQHRPWRYAIAAVVVLAIGAVAFCSPQMQKLEENVLPEIEIGYVPEGYTLEYSKTNEAETRKVWQYENVGGNILKIYADINKNNLSRYIDNEYHDKQYTVLNNGKQVILLFGDEKRANSLIWTDFDDSVALIINGKVSEEELTEIANAIEIKEQIEY